MRLLRGLGVNYGRSYAKLESLNSLFLITIHILEINNQINLKQAGAVKV